MTKDTEKMLIDEELNEVSGGFYYKEKLSGKDIDKLCNKIDQLNVDSATKDPQYFLSTAAVETLE